MPWTSGERYVELPQPMDDRGHRDLVRAVVAVAGQVVHLGSLQQSGFVVAGKRAHDQAPEQLPPAIREYLAVQTAQDIDAALRAFSVTGSVTDQGETFRGTEEVEFADEVRTEGGVVLRRWAAVPATATG